MKSWKFNRSSGKRHEAGFSMLEVMLAIAVLSFALLALAALQTALIKTSSDTKARSAATGLAQSQMDQFRGIEQRETEVGKVAYDDIVSGSLGDGTNFGGDSAEFPSGTIDVSGTVFTPSWTVVGYVFDEDTSSFVQQAVDDTSTPDYKLITVSVTWVDEAGQQQSVTIEDIVSKATPSDSARAIAGADTNAEPPIVGYEPQPAPEVVRVPTLGVGGSRFKETSKPLPDVLRNDFSTITTFSTVTFDETDSGAFETVRREDFFIVNCVCQFSGTGDALTPTVWDGKEYVVGDEITKTVGEKVEGRVGQFALSGQPVLCDTCCRDHHDALDQTDADGNAYPLYDPFRPIYDNNNPVVDQNGDGVVCPTADTAGCAADTLDINYDSVDHYHYFAPTNPQDVDSPLFISNRNSNALYYEVCRFIRVDGLLRVAQDFNMQAYTQLPSTQLQSAAGLSNYQSYVVSFVEQYVDEIFDLGSSYPTTLPDPAQFTYSGDAVYSPDLVSPADLPLQFLGRGIYVDFMSDTLQQCIQYRNGSLTADDDTPLHCLPEAGDVLDITPFYEVNVTLLANWSQQGNVAVTNEPIADGQETTYSRGLATSAANNADTTIVNSVVKDSNSGLTDSRRIDSDEITREIPGDQDSDYINSYYAESVFQDAGMQQRIIIRGILNLAGQVTSVTPSDILVEGRGDAVCTKPTDDSYRCIIEVADDYIADPTVIPTIAAGMAVSNYGDVAQQGNSLVFEDNNVCATGINFERGTQGEGGVGETVFYRFILADPTIVYLAGEETILNLDLDVVPQNRACSQDPVGTISLAL